VESGDSRAGSVEWCARAVTVGQGVWGESAVSTKK
jgi:hypothetical protein